MKDQTSSSPTNPSPTQNIAPLPKMNILMPILLTLLISGVIFGLGGYYLGSKYQKIKPATSTLTNEEADTSMTINCDETSVSMLFKNIVFCIPQDWKPTNLTARNIDVVYAVAPVDADATFGYGEVEPVFRVSDQPYFTFDSGAFCLNVDENEQYVGNLSKRNDLSIRTIGIWEQLSHTDPSGSVCSEPIAQTVIVAIGGEQYYFEIGLDDVSDDEQTERLQVFHNIINSIQQN